MDFIGSRRQRHGTCAKQQAKQQTDN